MVIRDVIPEDAEGIVEIYNDYILKTVVTFDEVPLRASQMQQLIVDTMSSYPWLVCYENNEMVGYSYVRQWKSRLAYQFSVESTVYIKDGFYGQGYGLALYTQLLERLRNGPYHVVIAGITLPNDASVMLHEKLGFKKIGQFNQVGRKFDNWLDVGYWQLILPED
jgi:phosphinothricin acetyltransferase